MKIFYWWFTNCCGFLNCKLFSSLKCEKHTLWEETDNICPTKRVIIINTPEMFIKLTNWESITLHWSKQFSNNCRKYSPYSPDNALTGIINWTIMDKIYNTHEHRTSNKCCDKGRGGEIFRSISKQGQGLAIKLTPGDYIPGMWENNNANSQYIIDFIFENFMVSRNHFYPCKIYITPSHILTVTVLLIILFMVEK